VSIVASGTLQQIFFFCSIVSMILGATTDAVLPKHGLAFELFLYSYRFQIPAHMTITTEIRNPTAMTAP
jgi:hypothetical protein